MATPLNQCFDTGFSRDCIVRETDKAYCFTTDKPGVTRFAGERQIWLPKRVVQWAVAQPLYAETAHVPVWVAHEKGLTR